MQEYIQYSPIIILVIIFAIQYKIFVTPSQLNAEFDKREKALKDEIKENLCHYDKELNEVKGEFRELIKIVNSLSTTVVLIQKDIEYIKKAIDSIPKRKED